MACACCRTTRTVLADPEIDAVVLATPHIQHTGQILAPRGPASMCSARSRSASMPPAPARGRRPAPRQGDARRRLQLAHQPALQAIRRMIDDGRLGRVLHLEGNFCGPSAYRFPPRALAARPRRGPGRRHDRPRRACGGCDAVPRRASRRRSRRRATGWCRISAWTTRPRCCSASPSGATGYVGTVIATAETWRLQVFGSKAWVGGRRRRAPHTWEMKVCRLGPGQHRGQAAAGNHDASRPTSTERAELEHFAARGEGRPAAGRCRAATRCTTWRCWRQSVAFRPQRRPRCRLALKSVSMHAAGPHGTGCSAWPALGCGTARAQATLGYPTQADPGGGALAARRAARPDPARHRGRSLGGRAGAAGGRRRTAPAAVAWSAPPSLAQTAGRTAIPGCSPRRRIPTSRPSTTTPATTR